MGTTNMIVVLLLVVVSLGHAMVATSRSSLHHINPEIDRNNVSMVAPIRGEDRIAIDDRSALQSTNIGGGGSGGGGGRGGFRRRADDEDEAAFSDKGEEDADDEEDRKNRLGMNKKGGDEDGEEPAKRDDFEFDDEDAEKGICS